MSLDDDSTRAWNEAVEALERAEAIVPARLTRLARNRGRRSVFATVVSAVLVMLFSVLLGRPRR